MIRGNGKRKKHGYYMHIYNMNKTSPQGGVFSVK